MLQQVAAYGGDAGGLVGTLEPNSEHMIDRTEWGRWLDELEQLYGAKVVQC